MNKPKFSKMKKFIASSALVFTLLTSSNLGLVTNTVIDTIGKAYVAYAADENVEEISVKLTDNSDGSGNLFIYGLKEDKQYRVVITDPDSDMYIKSGDIQSSTHNLSVVIYNDDNERIYYNKSGEYSIAIFEGEDETPIYETEITQNFAEQAVEKWIIDNCSIGENDQVTYVNGEPKSITQMIEDAYNAVETENRGKLWFNSDELRTVIESQVKTSNIPVSIDYNKHVQEWIINSGYTRDKNGFILDKNGDISNTYYVAQEAYNDLYEQLKGINGFDNTKLSLAAYGIKETDIPQQSTQNQHNSAEESDKTIKSENGLSYNKEEIAKLLSINVEDLNGYSSIEEYLRAQGKNDNEIAQIIDEAFKCVTYGVYAKDENGNIYSIDMLENMMQMSINIPLEMAKDGLTLEELKEILGDNYDESKIQQAKVISGNSKQYITGTDGLKYDIYEVIDRLKQELGLEVTAEELRNYTSIEEYIKANKEEYIHQYMIDKNVDEEEAIKQITSSILGSTIASELYIIENGKFYEIDKLETEYGITITEEDLNSGKTLEEILKEKCGDDVDLSKAEGIMIDMSAGGATSESTSKELTIAEQMEQQYAKREQAIEDGKLNVQITDDSESVSGEMIEGEAFPEYCLDKSVPITYVDERTASYETMARPTYMSHEISYSRSAALFIDRGSKTYENDPKKHITNDVIYTIGKYTYTEYKNDNVLDYLAYYDSEMSKSKLQNYIWNTKYIIIPNGFKSWKGAYGISANAYNTAQLMPTIPVTVNAESANVTYDFTEECYYVGPMTVNYTLYGIYSGELELFKGIKEASIFVDGNEIKLGKDSFVYDNGRTVDLASEFEGWGYEFPMPEEEFYVKIERSKVGQDAKEITNIKFTTQELKYSADKKMGFGESTKVVLGIEDDRFYGGVSDCTEHPHNLETGLCEGDTHLIDTDYIVGIKEKEEHIPSQPIIKFSNPNSEVIETPTDTGVENLKLTMNISGVVWLDNGGEKGDNVYSGDSLYPGPDAPIVTIIGTKYGYIESFSGAKYNFTELPVDKYMVEYSFNGKDYVAVKPLSGGVENVQSSRATYAPKDLEEFNSNFANIYEVDGKYYIKSVDENRKWVVSEIYAQDGDATADNRPKSEGAFSKLTNTYKGALEDIGVITSIFGQDVSNTVTNALNKVKDFGQSLFGGNSDSESVSAAMDAEGASEGAESQTPEGGTFGTGTGKGTLFSSDTGNYLYELFKMTTSTIFVESAQVYPVLDQISLAETKAKMPNVGEVDSVFEDGSKAPQMGKFDGSEGEIFNFGVYEKNDDTGGGGPKDPNDPPPGPDDPVNYPDLELTKDLYQVKLTINGKEKTYEAKDLWDETNKTYNLYITQADYFYRVDNYRETTRNTAETANSIKSVLTENEELRIFATYKYGYKNNSTNYAATLNELTDWYDDEYEYQESWYQIGDTKTHLQAELKDTCEYEGFKELIIKGTNGKVIPAENTLDVYVTFEVGKETYSNGTNQIERSLKIDCDPITKTALDGKRNVSEIKSYTIYKKETTDANLNPSQEAKNSGVQVNGVYLTEPTNPLSSGWGVLTGKYHDFEPINHPYLDIAGNEGDAIKAAGSGTVYEINGRNVKIDHGNGVTTQYGLLKEVKVSVGQQVQQGDVIGTMGVSEIPHLAFWIKINGKCINPKTYLYNLNTLVNAEKSAFAGKTDEDSAPGNANPNTPEDKREDDTAEAPRLNILITTNERLTTGYVFEDSRTEVLEESGQIVGNGTYEKDKEKLVNDITVQLVEIISKTNEEGNIVEEYEYVWQEAKSGHEDLCYILNMFGIEAVTKTESGPDISNGTYKFNAYHVGNYIIKFIYGDTVESVVEVLDDEGIITKPSYNGLDYKATAYQVGVDNDENDDSYIDNKWDNATAKGQADKNGQIANSNLDAVDMKFDTDTISDARDNEIRRLELMKLLANVTNGIANPYDIYTMSKEYLEAKKTGADLAEILGKIETFKSVTNMNASTAKINVDLTNVGMQTVNLGLEERPRTIIETTTRITRLQLVPQGDTTDVPMIDVEFKYDDEGKITEVVGNGSEHILTKVPTETDLGFKFINVDEKILQGAEINVEFENIVENVSQVDTIGDGLYTYIKNQDISEENPYEKAIMAAIQQAIDELKAVSLNDKKYGAFLGNTYYTGKYNRNTDEISETMIKQILDFVPNGLVFAESNNQKEGMYWQQITPDELTLQGLIGDNTYARDENGNYIYEEIDGKKQKVILDANGVSYYTQQSNNLAVNTVGEENSAFIKYLKPAAAISLMKLEESNKVTMKLNASIYTSPQTDINNLAFNNIFEVVNFINMSGRTTRELVGNVNPQKAKDMMLKTNTVADGLVGSRLVMTSQANHTAVGETLTFTPPTGSTELVIEDNMFYTLLLAGMILVWGIIILKLTILRKKKN